MRLLQSILLVFVLMSVTSAGLYAQCAISATNQGVFLTQNPKAKAAMIAAASADIEERVDPNTGSVYYVQRTVNPWSGSITYQIVHFNAETEAFETGMTSEGTAVVDPHQGDNAKKPCPDSMPRDSCQQRRNNSSTPVHQPRRSSTIKIAERF